MNHAQGWSRLKDEPRRHPVRPVGDGFTYFKSDTHADSRLFWQRQQQRMDEAKGKQ